MRDCQHILLWMPISSCLQATVIRPEPEMKTLVSGYDIDHSSPRWMHLMVCEVLRSCTCRALAYRMCASM